MPWKILYTPLGALPSVLDFPRFARHCISKNVSISLKIDLKQKNWSEEEAASILGIEEKDMAHFLTGNRLITRSEHFST